MSTDCTDYCDNSCNISPIFSREISDNSDNKNYQQNQMSSPNQMYSPYRKYSPDQLYSPTHERKEVNLFPRESSSYQYKEDNMQMYDERSTV